MTPVQGVVNIEPGILNTCGPTEVYRSQAGKDLSPKIRKKEVSDFLFDPGNGHSKLLDQKCNAQLLDGSGGYFEETIGVLRQIWCLLSQFNTP